MEIAFFYHIFRIAIMHSHNFAKNWVIQIQILIHNHTFFKFPLLSKCGNNSNQFASLIIAFSEVQGQNLGIYETDLPSGVALKFSFFHLLTIVWYVLDIYSLSLIPLHIMFCAIPILERSQTIEWFSYACTSFLSFMFM